MASSYPGALDSFTNPSSTDAMDASAALYHDVQHANANDAIEAIEAELGTDPAGGAATVKARLEANDWGGAISVGYWPSSAGWISTQLSTGAATTGSLTQNLVYYFPWWCPVSSTLDRIQVEVTTGQTSANARIGIYAASATTGGPTSLVLDCGEVDCSGTGVKTLTISQAVTGGTMYWLALHNETTNTAYRASGTSATRAAMLDTSTSTALSPNGYENVSYASGLPSTASASLAASSTGIIFWLRRS